MFSYENERFFIVLKQTIPTEIPKTKKYSIESLHNEERKICTFV